MAAKPVQLIVGCFLHMHFLNYYFLLHIITDFVYQTCYYQKIKIEMFFHAPPEIPSNQHHCWMHLIYLCIKNWLPFHSISQNNYK